MKELQSQLKQLPEKAKRSRLISIIKSVTGPVLDAARAEVNAIELAAQSEGRLTTGNLYGSLGQVVGRSKEYPNVQVAPRVSGNSATYWRKRSASGGRRKSSGSFAGFHAHLVHFGTSARKTTKGWRRGSAAANPFMERAFRKTLPGVKANFESRVAKEVENLAKKNILPKL
jgi:hypothetical protein